MIRLTRNGPARQTDKIGRLKIPNCETEEHLTEMLFARKLQNLYYEVFADRKCLLIVSIFMSPFIFISMDFVSLVGQEDHRRGGSRTNV